MKPVKFFILSAGAILLGAALIRFIIATGDAQTLSLPEPLLGIPLRCAVLITGAVELTVALICLFGKQNGFQLTWLTWLATCFLAYQIGLRSWHIHPQATLLGSLTDPLRLSYGIPGRMMSLLPFCLAAGSYGASLWLALSPTARTDRRMAAKQQIDQRDAASGLLKMLCPSCGGHIKFSGQNLGQQMPCPHCQKSITLRKSENLKMSCFFCNGHIEFPAHAIGEKLNCPHCKKDITLKETV